MAKLLTRRLFAGLVILIFVSILVFGATQALPSDPAQAVLGRSATPESLSQLRRELHLNDPAVKQYADWITGVLHGDLGRSLVQGGLAVGVGGAGQRRPVTEIVGPMIVNSALLMLIAGVVAIPLGLLVGTLSGLKRDRTFDHVFSFSSLVLAAMPEFVVGVVLIFILATGPFHVLPPVSLIDPDISVLHQSRKLVLPALVLILAVTPYVARMIRASVIEVLESDYVEMARLKGLRPSYILSHHVLPNAIIPTISVIALQFAYLAGSVVVVESVFGYPGIGSGLAQSVALRDLPTIQALAILIGAFYVILNLFADVATILINPRLRTGHQR